MMHSPWFIIADDFTGSGDSAVQFRSEGCPARLAIKPEVVVLQASLSSAIVVNTDSRYLSPQKSYDSVHAVAEFLANAGAKHFFKKIDSTMRGHIEDEVAAVMDGAGFRRALVCPAAPRNGRTVVDGLCLVDGNPIDSSASAKDPFTPVNQAKVFAHFERRFSGHIADLPLSTVRKGASELLRAIDEAPGSIRLFTADAATLSDLAIIASAAVAQGLLLVGSSGLAEALARHENRIEADPGDHSGVVRLPSGRMAFFVGSVTATSVAQCARLAESENVLRLVVNGRSAADDPEAEMGRMLDLLRQGPAGKTLLVHTDSIESGASAEGIKARGSLISQFLGNLALAASRERDLGFLFAMGGDTAARVAAALGADYIDFTDELLPGLPYGYFESNALGRRLYFASKSGGFGSADALLEVLARLTAKESTI
ncbi:MAG: four-carbon acid sugar kinase family protein [Rectinemataceae bacterium]|nr:four-carbon acid sugar kinase family protein [Rectinemataceae bacterium]